MGGKSFFGVANTRNAQAWFIAFLNVFSSNSHVQGFAIFFTKFLLPFVTFGMPIAESRIHLR